MRVIEPSELLIREDGSIYHLHLRPEQLADVVILVGDPGRVETVASYFSEIECKVSNREFCTITGTYNHKRVSVVSTGIGTDNIDIVVNELDALVNIDFATRTVKPERKKLTLVRLGTSGAIQGNIPLGSHLLSAISVGFDGLLNFYGNRDSVCDLALEAAFKSQVGWGAKLTSPYFVSSSKELLDLFAGFTITGATISAPGFYGPQGRVLRLPLADPSINDKIEAFEHNGVKITNFEMESSALAGLAKLLGHDATTICTIIANRVNKTALSDYSQAVNEMIEKTLKCLLP
ncbi:nucleoside phosphorylase [uncultured Acetobacteroides sp.]|uniref:nucleoside phosphorylase n=1 Tax=uncultured Acetobacteroides sp. TaxID=1760811 RepID=UPI0029F59A3F|nr:nucleoside phosphorylase [uncultured Acetobacteroides sp.]